MRKLEKIKPFSHSNASFFSKKRPVFAHFPCPAETDPYGPVRQKEFASPLIAPGGDLLDFWTPVSIKYFYSSTA